MRECPQCPAIWTQDEIDEQCCFACGYPHHTSQDDEDFEDFEDHECNLCGMVGDHNIGCPDNDSPFANLIREGFD